ncbi:hypothetical protein FACS1894208_08730 [Clostridia bacterium]|nr:hypothetical protein FACS1894208_08730 [Clostridia bacterium]
MYAWERRRRLIVKTLLYVLTAFLALILQISLPPLSGSRPQTLIIAAAMIAFFEGPKFGGAFGFVCGLLCDWLAVHTISYYLTMLTLLCVVLGWFVERVMRRNLFSALAASLAVYAVTQGLFLTFHLWLAGIADPAGFLPVAAPEMIFSLALAPVFYIVCRAVRRRLSDEKRSVYGRN